MLWPRRRLPASFDAVRGRDFSPARDDMRAMRAMLLLKISAGRQAAQEILVEALDFDRVKMMTQRLFRRRDALAQYFQTLRDDGLSARYIMPP